MTCICKCHKLEGVPQHRACIICKKEHGNNSNQMVLHAMIFGLTIGATFAFGISYFIVNFWK